MKCVDYSGSSQTKGTGLEDVPIYLYYHQPAIFGSRTAYMPLLEELGAKVCFHEATWRKVAARSWRVGEALRKWGVRHTGSLWNQKIPWLDDRAFARHIDTDRPNIAHFLWGEFARPRSLAPYHQRGSRVAVTFHASVRNQPSVLGRTKAFDAADWIVVVSATQIPFFVERGFREDRIRVIHLGVDTAFFQPGSERERDPGRPLNGLLVGATERDHAFMADIMKRLPADIMQLRVRTANGQERHYQGVPGVELLPRLSDEELVTQYQDADLLCMPMLDCTANDAILEAMACGTPVMTNRVGGIPEYVPAEASVLMEDKVVEHWVNKLHALAAAPEMLWELGPRVREWALRFRWELKADEHRALYKEMLQA